MIRFEQVTKSFVNHQQKFTAVNELTMEIEDGEIFGILGESGAGKSTVLRLINQLETQDDGLVLIDDIDIATLSRKELQLMRENIAVVFQNYNLLNNKDVYHNILIALKIQGIDDTNRIVQALEFVGLNDKMYHYPSQLSGGEKQRVAIARAIVTRPKILLCDEPSSALDQKTTSEMLQILKNVNKDFNTTIVVVTHELLVAKEICNRVAIMEKGNLHEIVHVKQSLNQNINSSYSLFAKEVLES
ncbi:methionine ABC transporter ATP-binding protein [Erysipelothrix urinaevulpis]|uniref:methionine ABC transporter ATP-binding protein n=1 Tax=Erysipelothrix urinaevulpis TaxID=2683717 RepID=UPI001359DEA2|nr:ATP-binding cassette domain-containing protein [Erysipelothrix urinaevulpis]